ncbi:hypothetical protein W97_07752 [Coniosporium apollinis CBS 100218]|uniref:Uncharacterized protein n=1 Tax=Coniosporium apollinis (strain CBS 100218) TaxID=1168221 RepID=R7Z2V7_CONA1|nr:uncharacterized protein W97_07752 [Coniosporium apollinis CBS 100218]EON68428.1 hypothetical protein W97_07752 [Coniosporium apollinis CBS 100218]
MATAVAEVFVELVALISEADLEAAASTALVDDAGEELIAGGAGLLTGTTAEGEIILEPIFEEAGSAATTTDLVGSADLANLSKGQLHALWQDAKTFARWTGREIMKGALFQVGLEAVVALIAKNPSPGPDTSDLVQAIGAVGASLKILKEVSTEWRRWCIKNFSKREEFGQVRAEDNLILRFEIFRNKLGDVSSYMQKTLAPLLAQVNKNTDSANIGGLKGAMRTYADMILAVSKGIKEKEALMMHAGLKDHHDELQKARDVLN